MSTAPDNNRHEWAEVGAAVVLGVAGLLTSWSTYQASLWDGEQAAHYSQANATRVEASEAAIRANQREAVEIGLFTQWLNAQAHGDEKLAEFFRARFPPELAGPFEAWLVLRPLQNPKAPLSPFDDGGFKPLGREHAAQLEAQADAMFQSGQRANQISDAYVQATVFCATALFFAGIGQVFRVWLVRMVLVALAAAGCAIAIVRVLALPIQGLA
ncbi:MAG TPA: hypothetical protein VGH86_04565 [Phenylobacterium sp.]